MIFQLLIGKTYLLNKNTNEIHDLKRRKVSNCCGFIKTIKRRDKKYVNFKQALELFEKGKANGCRWCLPGFDTDKNN